MSWSSRSPCRYTANVLDPTTWVGAVRNTEAGGLSKSADVIGTQGEALVENFCYCVPPS